MTIYDTKDLRAEVEEESVSLFLYGEHAITMTLAEWRKLNNQVEKQYD